jgi:hypothetical protein
MREEKLILALPRISVCGTSTSLRATHVHVSHTRSGALDWGYVLATLRNVSVATTASGNSRAVLVDYIPTVGEDIAKYRRHCGSRIRIADGIHT